MTCSLSIPSLSIFQIDHGALWQKEVNAHLPISHTNLVIFYLELPVLFWHFQNTTYHLCQSPSTIELHVQPVGLVIVELTCLYLASKKHLFTLPSMVLVSQDHLEPVSHKNVTSNILYIIGHSPFLSVSPIEVQICIQSIALYQFTLVTVATTCFNSH